MIRDELFRISSRPYAVDLASLRLEKYPQSRTPYHGAIDAVWFRRRRGTLVAVIGTLYDSQELYPFSASEFLAAYIDGRYGGSWIARWDGESYACYTPSAPSLAEEHLAVLRPMLANYPAVPPGWHGWWRFETTQERRDARA